MAWLIRPAGSGVVLFTLGGLMRHHFVDTLLVTAWSWWSLLATILLMKPAAVRCSGFSLRSVSNEANWKQLCTLFKYTIVFWLAVHMLRGCVAKGPAHAQSDLITITMLYPMLLCLIWTVTFIVVAISGLSSGTLPLLAFTSLLVAMLGVAALLCAWVERLLPLLVIFTWLHLCRAAFRVSRRWGIWWQSSVQYGQKNGEQPEMARSRVIKFAVNPDSHRDLRTTYFVERRLGRIAARILMLICGTFLAVLGSFVLMAGIQQRSGLFLEDVMWWKSLEDGKSLEITNAGASVLTLGHNSSDAQETVSAVLSADETPHYAICGHKWNGLQLVDYALMSMVSYISPNEVNDLPRLLKLLFPDLDVSLKLPSSGLVQRRWLELEVGFCKKGGFSDCRNVTVISVSGTDVTRIADYAENVRMWTEPVSIQILSTVFPTVRIWPRDCASMVIKSIHDILGGLALQDDQWHYREVLDHVRQMPQHREVVVTGHSLGGGIALVVGALTGRLAVALQPPGVYNSLAKHQAQQRLKSSGFALHKRSVSLIFEGDWIQHFDGHGGLVQTMVCDQTDKSIAVGCHLLEGAVCHLLRHCGDHAGRFGFCRHEYQPTSTALSILKFVWNFVRESLLSSYRHVDLQPTLVACMAVSLAVVARHGAPPLLQFSRSVFQQSAA